MVIKQLLGSLKNTLGKLSHFNEILGKKGINMCTISIKDTLDIVHLKENWVHAFGKGVYNL